ncbi:hypothetical protein [Wolbachia endosymbiont of Mansonella perstans]|nr:hypothetical protein [Wolbachia endosymbiont of Mansonella perstans]
MSKLQLKIKDHDNNFVVLNNIRNLGFTLPNNREEIRDISSFAGKSAWLC